MKKCPFCAEEIQDEAVKCKHCGSLLEQLRQSSRESDLPSYKESKLLPKDFLLPNEEIYIEIRPYWNDFFVPTLLFGVFLLFAIFSSLANGSVSSWSPLFLITLGVFLINKAQWKKAVYAITNKRVIKIKGLINKDYTQCPLDKIQNIDLKIIGFNTALGHISFDTAGSNQKEVVWRYVLQPREVYQKVSQILHK